MYYDPELRIKNFGSVPGNGGPWIQESKWKFPLKMKYVGTNNDFYRSKWNKGENKSGKLTVNGVEKETPNLFNAMDL